VKQGIALSVFASVLFSVLYYYTTVLYPLGGSEIFSWRVLLAVPALALLIFRNHGWNEVARITASLRADPRLWLGLAASAALIGVQLWLFMWAPLHQKALDVSLGYFLLPLVMVLTGYLFYRERLSRVQQLAVAMAAAGVLHELIKAEAFSWVTALVMFGYPPYFMLRRSMDFGSLAALWFDMLLLTPVALIILQSQDTGLLGPFMAYPRLLGLIPLLGLISSVALICYISASRRLPLGLFGILGYVEPVLLFWVAFLFLHEDMAPGAWWTYIPIWIGVVLVVCEGLFKWLAEYRAQQ
jgi:chloramphenicol-sensitive protein RarD